MLHAVEVKDLGLSLSIIEQIWVQEELTNLSGRFTSNKTMDNAGFIWETQIIDSLFSSVGVPEFGVSDISENYDDGIEEALLIEAQAINEGFDRETQEIDPLLALVGSLNFDVTDIKKHYKTSVRPKIRVVKGPYEDDPDPLIALLGTLESDVTDIGERHDEYIGDALLAELWEDEDE